MGRKCKFLQQPYQYSPSRLIAYQCSLRLKIKARSFCGLRRAWLASSEPMGVHVKALSCSAREMTCTEKNPSARTFADCPSICPPIHLQNNLKHRIWMQVFVNAPPSARRSSASRCAATSLSWTSSNMGA